MNPGPDTTSNLVEIFFFLKFFFRSHHLKVEPGFNFNPELDATSNLLEARR